MTDREKQLKERDVRKLAPELDANSFMQMYMESNFPQTSALPSPEQSQRGLDVNQAQDDYLMQLLMSLDPQECPMIVELLRALMEQSDEQMDALSAQRPMEYDTPNLGANYSVLNAPSSNGIEPSRAFQPLS